MSNIIGILQAHPTWRYLQVDTAEFSPDLPTSGFMVGEGCLGYFSGTVLNLGVYDIIAFGFVRP